MLYIVYKCNATTVYSYFIHIMLAAAQHSALHSRHATYSYQLGLGLGFSLNPAQRVRVRVRG